VAPDAGEGDPPSRILLDACTLLNLYATGCMDDILRAVRHRFGVAAVVTREALWVLRGGGGDDAGEREPVVLEPFVAAGLIEVLELHTEDEFATFVAFATLIDDGEAATVFLAIHRGGAVATDDRKAIREMRVHAPGVDVWTTSQLVRTWADDVDAPPARVRAVLQAVRLRARFQPNRQDPLSAWWMSHLTSAPDQESLA
jgi:hypothetical protein